MLDVMMNIKSHRYEFMSQLGEGPTWDHCGRTLPFEIAVPTALSFPSSNGFFTAIRLFPGSTGLHKSLVSRKSDKKVRSTTGTSWLIIFDMCFHVDFLEAILLRIHEHFLSKELPE